MPKRHLTPKQSRLALVFIILWLATWAYLPWTVWDYDAHNRPIKVTKFAPIWGQPKLPHGGESSGHWPNFIYLGAEWAALIAVGLIIFVRLKESHDRVA